MMVLNDTQRAQIAENRAAALARKAAKQEQEQQQKLDDYQEVLSKALLEDKVEVLSKALLEDKVEAEPKSGGAAKSDDGKTLAELFLGEPDDKTEEAEDTSMQDPYMVIDSMDEDQDEDEDEAQESGESEGEQAVPEGRGSYSTIAMKNTTVQKFFVSGLTSDEYTEMNPNIMPSTLDKWVEACTKDQWADFLTRCSAEEAAHAKKIPNWYRSVANAVAIAEGKEQPFAMKLGRKRFQHKHEYLQHLVEELVILVQRRRHLKEKVDLKSVVHTLKKMIKEKETEMQSQG